jgi:hypothetical protein
MGAGQYTLPDAYLWSHYRFSFSHCLYFSLSGGVDSSHGNQTQLEGALNAANATWGITRYSDVHHAFTVWRDPRYVLKADARSWESMLAIFSEKMIMPEYKMKKKKSSTCSPFGRSQQGQLRQRRNC